MLERYRIIKCGGRWQYGQIASLYLLEDRKKKKDSILIDIKEVYEEKDNNGIPIPLSIMVFA